MLIPEKPKKVFEKPKPGLHLAVLADVIYTKDVPTAFGIKDQLRFVWVLEKKDSESKNFQVWSRPLNQTIDPKARLYETAASIRNGTPLPPGPFDPDSLIGSVNVLGVIHTPGTDKTGQPTVYVNVSSINPAEEGQTLEIPSTFIRDRDKTTKAFGAQRTATITTGNAAAPALEVEF